MERTWYVSRDGQMFGPFTPLEIKEAADAGRVVGTDLIQQAGAGTWRAASEFPGLITTRARATVMKLTCFVCYAEVDVGVMPGASSATCNACGREIACEAAAVDVSAPAFEGMGGNLEDRIRQRVADAYAAAEAENQMLGTAIRILR